jgi:hypothetical protein
MRLCRLVFVHACVLLVGGEGGFAEEMDREALVLGTVDYSGKPSYRDSLKPGKRLPHIGLRLVLVPVQ